MSYDRVIVAPAARGVCAVLAHRRATRPDAASIARLTPRSASTPAARGTVGAGGRFATGAERVQTGAELLAPRPRRTRVYSDGALDRYGRGRAQRGRRVRRHAPRPVLRLASPHDVEVEV